MKSKTFVTNTDLKERSVNQKYSEEFYDVPECLQRRRCIAMYVLHLGRESAAHRCLHSGYNTVQKSLRLLQSMTRRCGGQEGPRLQTDVVTPAIHTLQVTQKGVARLAMPRSKGGLTKSGLSGDICSSKAETPSSP